MHQKFSNSENVGVREPKKIYTKLCINLPTREPSTTLKWVVGIPNPAESSTITHQATHSCRRDNRRLDMSLINKEIKA